MNPFTADLAAQRITDMQTTASRDRIARAVRRSRRQRSSR